MKKPILTKEEIKWMMDNMDEVVSELRRKSELVKNFYQELEIYRVNKDRVGYNRMFSKLLKREEDKLKLNGRKNK
jgi:cobyric acid synthase